MALTYHSKKPFKDVEHFINDDGEHLFCRYYKPENEIKALLLVVHGYAEHSGRYERIGKIANELDMLMFAHDLSGHGESEGKRANTFNYEVFTRDILAHAKIMKEKYPNLPIYIYGHSMGGGLAVTVCHRDPNVFAGMILSAPLITVDPNLVTPLRLFGAKVLGTILPGWSLGSLPMTDVTRSKEVIKECEDDPMFIIADMVAGKGKEILRFVNDLRPKLEEIKTPYFIGHGDSDKVCHIDGSKLLHQLSKSEDKTFNIYPGMYHMMERDLEEDSEKFLNDVKSWISEHVK